MVVEHFAKNGVQDTSLRGLAAAIGSSHRMLSYHFGSRHGLLQEVSRAVELEQREAFVAMLADADASPVEVMWRMYRRICDPALRPHERLFYELYVRALQDDPGGDGFLAEVVEAWIPPLSRLFERLGFDAAEVSAEARLALAVARGLLLDLLATEDQAAVDAAMARFVARYEPVGG